MKIVKLNRNFKINRYHGFELGLKFDSWPDARNFEAACKQHLGNAAWMWKYDYAPVKGAWASGFASRQDRGADRGQPLPYWIYFRKESALSVVMLTVDQNG